MVDISPEIPNRGPVMPDLRLILADPPFGRMIAVIKEQTISVLLKLPLIPLQLALIDTEIGRAARLC